MAIEQQPKIIERNHYLEHMILEQDLMLRLGSTTLDRLQNDLSWMQAKAEYPVRAIEWEDEFVLLEEHPGLEIFDKPQPSESAHLGSQVIYFAKSRFVSPAILIQGSKQGEITTDHMHLKHTETFKIIKGEVDAHIEDEKGEKVLRVTSELVVPPGTHHQLKGAAEKSVVLLVTSGSNNCMEKSDHHYRPGNRFTS